MELLKPYRLNDDHKDAFNLSSATCLVLKTAENKKTSNSIYNFFFQYIYIYKLIHLLFISLYKHIANVHFISTMKNRCSYLRHKMSIFFRFRFFFFCIL
jgi:hypothetical protein